jgi:hypothetical protein
MFNVQDWPLVLLPIAGPAKNRWMRVDKCRMDCPANMKSVTGLRSHYAFVLQETILLSTIMPFMQDVIGVQKLSIDDIIGELVLQKRDQDPNENLICELYSWLSKLLADAVKSDKNSLK